MNILDIAQNSVRAEASLIQISLVKQDGFLELAILDNGKGMSEEMAQRVTDPFCTSRTTRKVGLGLPFLKMAAEMAGGSFGIQSKIGEGTKVNASFEIGNIDLMPIGDMGSTISVLVQANPNIDFVYTYSPDLKNNPGFVFDTREIRKVLGDVPLSEPEVALFIRDYINEHEQEANRPQAQ